LSALATRVTSIEDWFEIVNVGTSQSPEYALHAKQGRAIYSDSWIAAGGVGSGSASGGLITRVRSISDLGTTISTESLTETFSAKAIEGIYEAVTTLASNVSTNYATQSWVQNQGYLTSRGYIGTTQVQASSAKQSLAGILEIHLTSSTTNGPNGTLKPISISSGLTTKNGLRWTYQYIDNSTLTPTLQTVNKTIAFTDDIPTPKKLYFGSTTSGNYYDTTAQKVLDASLINGVTLTTAQTITGQKTFNTGGIVMDGANILTSTDSTNNIGASGTRFLNGHIRNFYTTYFAFMSDDGQTLRGNIGMGDGYANIIIAGTPNSTSYNFNATYGFFHGGNGNVPCGRSDHRWSELWMVDADLSGNLSLSANSHIDIGAARIEYDSNAKAIHITKASGNDDIGLYADSFVAAGGLGTNGQTIRYVALANDADYAAITTKDPATIYTIGGSIVTKIYLGTTLLFSEN
jgi:hypothetical protein